MAVASGDSSCIPALKEAVIEETAGEFVQSCSPMDFTQKKDNDSFDLTQFRDVKKDDLCKCLESAKLLKISVPDRRKEDFIKWEYDQAIREKLKHSFNDLMGNFTKFNNLLLSKEHLGNLSKLDEGLCSIKSMAQEIEKLQNDPENCPAPKKFFNLRLNEILGTSNMKEFLGKMDRPVDDVGPNSCLSKQLYMNLRSSNGASSTAFEVLRQKSDNLKQLFHAPLHSTHVDGLKDLLTYDVLFNLAYRDDAFREDFRKRISEWTSAPMNKRLYDIYNDKTTLQLAYNSLNRTCVDFSKNLKGFLCAREYPRLHPTTLNLHLDDYLKDKPAYSDIRNAARDYFTWEFSCNEGERTANRYRRTMREVLQRKKPRAVELSPEEKSFNLFLEDSILVKNVTKEPESDLAKFTSMFCKGHMGKEISQNDLPQMMQDFLKGKKLDGKLAELFAKHDTMGILYDPTKTPPFIINPKNEKAIKDGKLPYINQITWAQTIEAELLKENLLTKEEAAQLYAIIEMQTNRKFTEIEDVKAKLGQDYKSFTLREIDGIIRGDEDVINSVKIRIASESMSDDKSPGLLMQLPDISGHITAIQTTHKNVQKDIQEKGNPVQDLLLNKTSADAVREQGQRYSQNGGTYQGVKPTNPSVPGAPGNDSQKVVDQGSAAQDSRTSGFDHNSRAENNVPLAATSSTLSYGGVSPSKPTESISSESKSFGTTTTDVIPPTRAKSGHTRSSELQDEIKRIKDEIAKSQSDFNFAQKAFNNIKRQTHITSSSGSGGFTETSRKSTSYSYPKNLPVKRTGGDYYYPETGGAELSSAKKDKDDFAGGRKTGDKSQYAGTGGQSGAGNSALPGDGGPNGVDMGGLAGVGHLSDTNARGPASTNPETDDEAKKRQNLAVYEHHKYIPHAIFDVVGSVDKVVLLLGLEGKSFRTIEALEVVDKETQKLTVNYYQRTFDFVPEGEFEEFKEEFATKENREKAYQAYFNYPKTQDNLSISKKYAKATKEISKTAVTHNYVLKIQDDILSEEEIRNTINQAMEKLK